jgi:hypothetical protein
MFRKPRPSWWLVFAILPLMIGLLLIETRLQADAQIHKILEMMIVVFAFGLMWMWVRANQAALLTEHEPATRVYVIYDSTEDEPLDVDPPYAMDELEELEPAHHKGRYN